MNLVEVERFDVSPRAIARTERQLRSAGEQGFETWVLWTGHQDGRRFIVDSIHVPEQTAYRLESGLCVKVDGPALHALNVWMLEHGQTLGAQVHAHPEDAYHSDTDNAFSIVTALGGLSIVVPWFCRDGILDRTTAAFRLTRRGWRRSRVPITALLHLN